MHNGKAFLRQGQKVSQTGNNIFHGSDKMPKHVGGSRYATRAFATPIFVASATPIFVASATPYFRISATQTAATPKILF